MNICAQSQIIKQTGYFFLLASLIILASCGVSGGNNDPAGGQDTTKLFGKIVFSARDSAGTFQIYTIKANGAQLKQLTHAGSRGAEAFPSWSPNGEQIIYSSAEMSGIVGASALVVMDADGSHKHVLHRYLPDRSIVPLLGSKGRWSPDGTKIVYGVNVGYAVLSNSDICIFDTRTKTTSHLTHSPANDNSPVWSPDGNRIAYVSDENRGSDIYIMASNGKDKVRVTSKGNAGRILWYEKKKLIYWFKNHLYRLNLKTRRSTLIPTPFKSNIGFRPLSVTDNGKMILLLVFDYRRPHAKRSLQILDLRNNKNKLIKIYVKKGLANADWYYQNK